MGLDDRAIESRANNCNGWTLGYGEGVACFGWAARTLGHGGAVMRRQATLHSRSMNALSGLPTASAARTHHRQFGQRQPHAAMAAYDVGLLVRYVVGAAKCFIIVLGGLRAVPVSGSATPLKAALSMTGSISDTTGLTLWWRLVNRSGNAGPHSIGLKIA